jgi:hypothetical protein
MNTNSKPFETLHSHEIVRLFNAWPDHAERLTADQRRLYLDVCGSPEVDIRDLTKAVDDFVKGKVKGQKLDYLPRVAKIMDHIRECRRLRVVANSPKSEISKNNQASAVIVSAEEMMARRAMIARYRAEGLIPSCSR